MNIIAIKGRLVRDPEIRQTQSGVSVTNITVAVDRSYSAGGEKQTDFFDCVFWRQGADFVGKYFKKGKEIIVTGEMQSRKWQDKEGNNRISWEIQNAHAEFCGGTSGNCTVDTTDSNSNENDFSVIEDSDDLPF